MESSLAMSMYPSHELESHGLQMSNPVVGGLLAHLMYSLIRTSRMQCEPMNFIDLCLSVGGVLVAVHVDR